MTEEPSDMPEETRDELAEVGATSGQEITEETIGPRCDACERASFP